MRRGSAFVSCCLVLSSAAFAATTTTWQISGTSDFLKGNLSGLMLSPGGRLEPGPSVVETTKLDQPAVWSLAPAPNGGVYIGTGNNGAVIQVDASGKSKTVWTAPEAEVFAIAVSGDVLYAGSSPEGGLYRIERGSAKLLWKSPAKYIWALCPAPDGAIFAATGDSGRIYRVEPDGKAELYYETNQVNVTSLTVAPSGHLIAGTDPNGLVYDISGRNQATVLYDAPLPEIRSILATADGSIYVAAMGGAVANRGGSTSTSSTTSSTVVTATTPTVVTVTEAAENSASATQPPSSTSTSSSSTVTAGQTSGVVEVSGTDKSAIYKIGTHNAVETLRSSKEDNVYDIALAGNDLLVATDVHGRLYRLSGHRETLLAEIADGAITRLLSQGNTVWAAMSNPGRLYSLSEQTGRAEFESQIHDCTSVARWGHLQWHGSGSGLQFETRTGFTARPDSTWSSWAPVDQGSGLIASPPARFIQIRGRWDKAGSASVDSIAVPYLPQNNPPVVRSITVNSVLNQNAAKSAGTAASSATGAYTITVTDTGDTAAASTASSANQSASRLQATQTQVSWQADDPDGDRLSYSLYFRAEEEKDWQLIRGHIFENSILLDPDVFADGRYFFRVVASDTPSNAPEYAQESELVSTPVLIDNTPPDVEIGTVHRDGASVDVDLTAVDKTSPLRLCEYSLDAGAWQPIEASDGLTDSPREAFHLHLDKLRPGEHLLVFRVYDVLNNAGLAKTVLH